MAQIDSSAFRLAVVLSAAVPEQPGAWRLIGDLIAEGDMAWFIAADAENHRVLVSVEAIRTVTP